MKQAFAASAILGLGVSCATPEDKPLSWDNAVTVERSETKKATTTEELRAEAAEFVGVAECEAEARARLATDKRSAARLMKGCIARPDFNSMLSLSQPPWNALKFGAADYDLLMELSRRRGGLEIPEDFTQLGIPTDHWELFRQLPISEQKSTKLVYLKVLVLEQVSKPNGQVEAKARVYGTGMESSYTQNFSRSRSFGSTWRRETKEVRPIGAVVILRGAKPFPTSGRIDVLAQFNAEATDALRRRNKAADERMTDEEVMAAQKITDKDPREEAVLDATFVGRQAESSSKEIGQ